LLFILLVIWGICWFVIDLLRFGPKVIIRTYTPESYEIVFDDEDRWHSVEYSDSPIIQFND
jgi:hypothetical protein